MYRCENNIVQSLSGFCLAQKLALNHCNAYYTCAASLPLMEVEPRWSSKDLCEALVWQLKPVELLMKYTSDKSVLCSGSSLLRPSQGTGPSPIRVALSCLWQKPC